MSYEIEPGYFNFRAVANTADGSIQALYSVSYLCQNLAEFKESREYFIAKATRFGYTNIKITSFSRVDNPKYYDNLIPQKYNSNNFFSSDTTQAKEGASLSDLNGEFILDI